MNISVDNLFPSDNKSGTKGKKLDVESLFSNTPLNQEPEITFSATTLLERRQKRRVEKLNFYRHMLRYCHKRIADADEDQGTDIMFSVVESIPECKDYNSRECLEFISGKLREEDFDTTLLTNTTMFITWKYLELKKADEIKRNEIKQNETRQNEIKQNEIKQPEIRQNENKMEAMIEDIRKSGKTVKEIIMDDRNDNDMIFMRKNNNSYDNNNKVYKKKKYQSLFDDRSSSD